MGCHRRQPRAVAYAEADATGTRCAVADATALRGASVMAWLPGVVGSDAADERRHSASEEQGAWVEQ